MMIGLIGAHRTGKTTLAKHVESGVPSIKAITVNLGKAQSILGFDSAKQDYTFKERRTIQDGLLNYMAELYKESAIHYENVIFDRTPLDLIGYTISLANSNVLDQEDEVWLEDFIRNCNLLTEFYLDKLFLVQPGIDLITDNTTSAPAQKGYIEHLNYIYAGVITQINYRTRAFIIPRQVTDLDDRAHFVMTNK